VKKIFWLYLVVLGLVMVWLVPPFQKADEVIHFQNTAAIVSGRPWEAQVRFIKLPEKLKVIDVAFRYEKKFDGKRVWEKDFSKVMVTFGYLPDWRSYISYFPVEVGVWAGSFSVYPALSFYLGRMAGLILFLICVWLSLRIIPDKYADLVMAYAMIPMVIHQVTGVNHDVFLLCLAPLILAVFLKKNLVLLAILMALFIFVKPGYYPMVLLLPAVLWAKYKEVVIRKPWIVAPVVLACVPVVLAFIEYFTNNISGGTSGLINGVYQLEIIKHDPWQAGRILADTWVAKRDFYFKGVLGYFGWLDYEFDLYQFFIVVGIVLTFLVVTIRKLKKPIIGWVGFVSIGSIIFLTYTLIEMAFLIQWTVVGSTVVEGVQGRYLLPLVPLLLFWVSQFWLLVGKKWANLMVFGLVALVLVLGVVDKINKRYYDLSTNFRNKDEFLKEVEEPSYLSSKSKLIKMFHTSDGDVIGGFEMVINKSNDDLIRVPYRFAIKDAECKKEMRWGYLDLEKIGKEKVYLQKIERLERDWGDVCLEIEPIVVNDKEKYFDYVQSWDEPMVRLLFLSSEVN
jgi:uncharacterized membrane protein